MGLMMRGQAQRKEYLIEGNSPTHYKSQRVSTHRREYDYDYDEYNKREHHHHSKHRDYDHLDSDKRRYNEDTERGYRKSPHYRSNHFERERSRSKDDLHYRVIINFITNYSHTEEIA